MQRFMLATLISLSLGGCAGMFDDDDASLTAGGAEARISSVPPAVSCISINAVGSRSVTNNFNVTAGQSATLRLSNLPVGSDTFTAFAYPTDCSKIASTQPTWASAAVVATISNGGVTNLALTLSPSGGANVGVSFDTDGGTGSTAVSARTAASARMAAIARTAAPASPTAARTSATSAGSGYSLTLVRPCRLSSSRR